MITFRRTGEKEIPYIVGTKLIRAHKVGDVSKESY